MGPIPVSNASIFSEKFRSFPLLRRLGGHGESTTRGAALGFLGDGMNGGLGDGSWAGWTDGSLFTSSHSKETTCNFSRMV